MEAQGKAPKDDKWKAKYKEPAGPDTSELAGLPRRVGVGKESSSWVIVQLGTGSGPLRIDQRPLLPNKIISEQPTVVTEKNGLEYLADVLEMEFSHHTNLRGNQLDSILEISSSVRSLR